MISGKCDLINSLDMIKLCFRAGLVTLEGFEKTLRDHQALCDEIWIEQRDRAAAIIGKMG